MLPWIPAAISGGTTLAGGLMSLLGKSKPAQMTQLPRFSPEQSNMMNQLAQQGMQNVDPAAIQKQAMGKFTSDVMPSIAARFASMGGAGAQRSSAFPAALAGAGAEMQGNIAAMMPQLGLQQLMMGLQPQFDTMRQPEQQGMMQGLGSSSFSGGMQSLLPNLDSLFGQKQQDPMAEILEYLKKQQGQQGQGAGESASAGAAGTANPLYENQANPPSAMPQPMGGGNSYLNALRPNLASILQGGY